MRLCVYAVAITILRAPHLAIIAVAKGDLKRAARRLGRQAVIARQPDLLRKRLIGRLANRATGNYFKHVLSFLQTEILSDGVNCTIKLTGADNELTFFIQKEFDPINRNLRFDDVTIFTSEFDVKFVS